MMNTYYLDLTSCKEKQDLYKLFEALPAEVHPDNLDALYDMLTSITQETKLIINNYEGYQACYPEYFNVFIELCKDAQNNNNLLDIHFLQ
ncbi:barstar family protein [Sharpea azabuensis]|uniref:Barstar (Barnase inhibitor) n=1 Tax=Sharpea azabuensis TaxID=322505 RepID=A0A1H6XH57_9FIRM|nr:barstar family protein [Sharpea azabuensis]SEJ24182.1 Barstar (barnase inhibitor) [Sharpea azabuensis]